MKEIWTNVLYIVNKFDLHDLDNTPIAEYVNLDYNITQYKFRAKSTAYWFIQLNF